METNVSLTRKKRKTILNIYKEVRNIFYFTVEYYVRRAPVSVPKMHRVSLHLKRVKSHMK